MADSSSPADPTMARPLPPRNTTAPPRTVAGLLSRRPMASSPMPPSLQAKMDAVRIMHFFYAVSTSSSRDRCQMLARGGQKPVNSVDAATNAMRNATLLERPQHPALRTTVSSPAPGRPSMAGGLAARRAKADVPKLNIREFEMDHLPPGGGASGAGLGRGRPQVDDEIPRRSPQATWGTPFENFGKIMFVSRSVLLVLDSSARQGSVRCP